MSSTIEFGMTHCEVNYLVFSLHSSSMCIYVAVYVDVIITPEMTLMALFD